LVPGVYSRLFCLTAPAGGVTVNTVEFLEAAGLQE
jgi:hypothetical protein